MQYQIMKEGMPIAEFAEEADAKIFLKEKQEKYAKDMYGEWLHTYMEEHGIKYPGDVSLAEVDGEFKRIWNECKNIFQLNDSSADRNAYADKLVEKITPIFEKAKAVMDKEMEETADESTDYEYEDIYLDLYSGINSFLAGGSEAKTLLNDCFSSDGDSKLEDMLISIRKNELVAAEDVYPVLDSVRDLKRDYQGIESVNRITDNEKNEEKSFAQQVDEVLNGTYNRYNSDLKVGDTPQILLDVGCKQLPIFYTKKHLKDAIRPKGYKGEAVHHHGLTVNQIKDISNLLADPVMVYDSLSKDNSIVIVTSEFDQDKCPIIAVIQPNGNARYNLEVVPSNFMLSVYGRNNFEGQLDNAINDDKILYINKNKSQMLFSVLGLQLSKGLNNIDFDIIIHKSRNIVNSFNKNSEKNNYESNQKKQIKEITDRLEQGITELFNSERYKEYLQVMSKFHNYSFNNTLLIAMQNPNASLVAGFNAWKNKFGRNVMKGEKGIRILAPAPYKTQQQVEKKDPQTGKTVIGMDGKPVMETKEVQIPAFKVVSVFDVSQTEGRELPAPAVSELTGNVEQYKDFYAALEKTSPVPMRFEKIEGGSHGYYHLKEKRIAIAEGMSELQNLKTAIHEIAHSKLHDIDLKAPQEEQGERPDRRTREVQAESIAYTVCQHYGLDTSDYSFGYIAEWSSGRELAELKSSLETIRITAAEIIGSIDGHFAELQKQRKTEKEREVEKKLTHDLATEPTVTVQSDQEAAEPAKEDAKEEMQPEQSKEENFPTPDPNAEPVVTIIWSEHSRFHDGETMSLSEANAVIGSLDEATTKEDGYYKTKFRIDFVMDGNPDCYVGRQDLGDGDGTLIDHIEKYHASFENNEQWDNYLLRNGNTEALEADKAQRDMLLHEFVPYLKLHDNLFKMEQTAIKALQGNEAMTSTETAYHTAMQEYVSKCRTMVNSGDYDLPPAPQLKDFDTELEAYKKHVEEEIVQEAAAAGMTVEEYAANGYESYKTVLPEKAAKEQEEIVDNIRGNEDYYRYFYSGEQDRQAEDFAREKGWKKIWAGDSQGMNGDTWIVYREISDLPKFLREYAEGQERSADRAAAHAAQTEHCKDKGSWTAMIANRKIAASEKGSNTTVTAQEQKPNIHKGDFGK